MVTDNDWLAIIQQGTYWVPRAGWHRYIAGTPLDDLVAGIERLDIATMDRTHLRRLPAFVLERFCAVADDAPAEPADAWTALTGTPLMTAILSAINSTGGSDWPAEFVLTFTADVTAAAYDCLPAATCDKIDTGTLDRRGLAGRARRQAAKGNLRAAGALRALAIAPDVVALTNAGAGEAAWSSVTKLAQAAAEFIPNDLRRVFLADAMHPITVIEAAELLGV